MWENGWDHSMRASCLEVDAGPSSASGDLRGWLRTGGAALAGTAVSSDFLFHLV